MGAFVVCWLPFFLLYVIKPFCVDCHVPLALERFVLWLGYLNSLLNPIIYICCKPLFRLTFKRILLLQYCRKQGQWKLTNPAHKGILVNSSRQNRPNSSSDGPSGARRKKPGRVMFADCPRGELVAAHHGGETSLSRTPTLPPERNSDGVVTYRNFPTRSTGDSHNAIHFIEHVKAADDKVNNNTWLTRNKYEARNDCRKCSETKTSGKRAPKGHSKSCRTSCEGSIHSSSHDVSGSKFCCRVSKNSLSSDECQARNVDMARAVDLAVEEAREAINHCSSGGAPFRANTDANSHTRTTVCVVESPFSDNVLAEKAQTVNTTKQQGKTTDTQGKKEEANSDDGNLFREILV
ncbi:uncharacterized protein [Diadema setosum]|uniref:uncharacterized protein n=1 Tax=Diadema setosum TaxID=31175 RepID=UPI003B39FE41